MLNECSKLLGFGMRFPMQSVIAHISLFPPTRKTPGQSGSGGGKTHF
jgi:hypothetical protein